MLERYSHLVDRDAYAALLRAQGLEPPEPVSRDTLMATEGELQPVVPIVAAPRPRPPPMPAGAIPQTQIVASAVSGSLLAIAAALEDAGQADVARILRQQVEGSSSPAGAVQAKPRKGA